MAQASQPEFASPAAPHRIVLMAGANREAIRARVRAELESDGWQVVAVEPDEALLDSVAHDNGAVAAIRVRTSPLGCEIWVTSHSPDSSPSSEVIEATSPSDAVLALQAVEVLRARLLKVGILAPRAVVSVAPPTSRITESHITLTRAHAPLWVGLGSALLVSPGGFSPSVSANAAITLRLRASLIANARFWVPVTASQNDQPEGSSRFWHLGGSGGIGVELGHRDSLWSARAHTGVGAAWLQFQTESAAPFVAHAPSILTGYNYAGLEGYRQVSSRLRLGIIGTSGLVWSRPVLTVTERAVAHFGRPFVTLGINAEFDVAPR